ncbi:SulP family inorganic anion transporter [Rhodoferax sp.]|uniref:SulP family inorganic anion transporter n=1 Tax=Rhodoferax sp. TaxID=50421 RepID=UPI0026390455|nr:SulP family inorganic anion transporter [Rhodoferax sp.]MDD2811421.1 SulP family inorganic anion transporter [Rhodoferax sp.]MDD4943243.1 SulP family inorganic anion transporter [Rhodoferax sp.]
MRFSEVRAGLESSIHGFATSIGPVLVFAGLFGSVSLAAALWATLVTAVCVPLVRVLLRAHPSIHTSSRAASLLAYAALVLQLSLANVATVGHQSLPTVAEFAIGMAAASLLFALASGLITLAGVLKLGHIFKMIPSTVTAGISNSTAALLVLIACRQLWSSPLQALAAAILMVLAYWGWSQSQQRWPVLRVVPNVLVAVLVGLCLSGWLAEPVSAAATVADVSWNTQWMGVVLWPQLLGQDHLIELLWIGIPGMLTLALVMILESHTACSTMEARFGVRIQANHELLVLGCTNLLCAALGGVPSTGSPIRCISNWIAGGRGKSAVAVAALVTGGLVLALAGL